MMNWLLDRGAPGALGPGEVVVWRIEGIADPARGIALAPLLSGDERARAAAMPHPVSRAAFTVTRATLRRLLARHLAVPPQTLRFDYGPAGKPSLPGAAVHFSVTHSGGNALIAVTDSAVGVDLEQVRARPRMEQILERIFTPVTRTTILALPPRERLDAFHAAWTQREAYVKAVGGRIFSTPDRLAYVHPGAAVELVSESNGDTWTVVPLQPWPGYRGAVIARGTAEQIRFFEATALDD